jgi:hypothetical protein
MEGESNLTAAQCSGESSLTAVSFSREIIWQGEPSLKTLEDSLGPERGNDVKDHIWGNFTIILD